MPFRLESAWLGRVLFFSMITILNKKHTGNAVKSYLERKTADKTLTVMDWPPQSPDLNIIEAVWDHLDRERNKGQPKSKEELKEMLKEAWYNIPEDYFWKLQDGLPKEFKMCFVPKEVTLNTDFCHFVLKLFIFFNCVSIFPLFPVCILIKW